MSLLLSFDMLYKQDVVFLPPLLHYMDGWVKSDSDEHYLTLSDWKKLSTQHEIKTWRSH